MLNLQQFGGAQHKAIYNRQKNWLFSGSPAGVAASAATYSIIETCIVNDIDPREYLVYILTEMPKEKSGGRRNTAEIPPMEYT